MTATALIKTPLDRFYEHLAYKPWCGDDKAARLVRPKESAISKPYIAPNSPALVSWLVFDLDHSNSWIWEDKNLPEPNIIVSTPSTGRSHLYYAISPICISDNARIKPIEYMKAVYRGLARALIADEAYTGRIAKNPFCDHWKTIQLHSYQYNLEDLASVVDPISKPLFTPKEEEDSRGRNCDLFLNLRYWAYAHVLKAKTELCYDDWLALVTKRGFSLSKVEADFKENEIEGVARSIAKWTWQNYTGDGIDRGVMGLDKTDLTLVNRQRLSARRTHSVRSASTEKRIRAAIAQLTNDKAKVTKSAVARIVGISRQQVSSRYSHVFQELPAVKSTQKTASAISSRDVNYGVYQISAPFRGRVSLSYESMEDQVKSITDPTSIPNRHRASRRKSFHKPTSDLEPINDS